MHNEFLQDRTNEEEHIPYVNIYMYTPLIFRVCRNTHKALSNFLFFILKSYYSVKKAAVVLGIETDNVIAVKCDKR